MRAVRLFAVATGLAWAVSLGVLISAGSALADGPADSAPVSITFENPEAKGEDGGLSVSVRLTTADGEPITRQPVEFFVTTELFDGRPVALRSVLTNAEGKATITYTPTWEGEHRITAQFAGDETFQPTEATSVLNVSGIVSSYTPPPEPLSPLRQWATPGAVAVVLTVWLILAAVIVRVCWGVWHYGQRRETAAERGRPPKRVWPDESHLGREVPR
jgi:hypothetical protein